MSSLSYSLSDDWPSLKNLKEQIVFF